MMLENKNNEIKSEKEFADSPVSKELSAQFSKNFGTRLARIALLKSCAVVSCKLDRPRLSVMHVAPTRQFKSYTSREVMDRFRQRIFHRSEVGF